MKEYFVLDYVIIVYLVIFGGVFATWGSNPQSRIIGILGLMLALGQWLRIAGIV
jgi:hypothetical protein